MKMSSNRVNVCSSKERKEDFLSSSMLLFVVNYFVMQAQRQDILFFLSSLSDEISVDNNSSLFSAIEWLTQHLVWRWRKCPSINHHLYALTHFDLTEWTMHQQITQPMRTDIGTSIDDVTQEKNDTSHTHTTMRGQFHWLDRSSLFYWWWITCFKSNYIDGLCSLFLINIRLFGIVFQCGSFTCITRCDLLFFFCWSNDFSFK